MTPTTVHTLVRRQHWVITRRQLLALGYSVEWIRHAIKTRELYVIHRGVYAVGRRQLSQEGYFIAAVLACGDHAVLSHESAATLWGIRKAATDDRDIGPMREEPAHTGHQCPSAPIHGNKEAQGHPPSPAQSRH